MGINLVDGFNVTVAKPLDERSTVADLTARDAIPSGVRYQGMPCYVADKKLTYFLSGGITNADWKPLGAGSGGSGSGSTLNLIYNPSFEAEVSVEQPLEWALTGAGTLTIDGTAVLPTAQNTKSLKVALGSAGSAYVLKTTGAAYAGTKGCMTVWVKTDAARTVAVYVDGVNVASVSLAAASNWQEVKLNFVFGTTDVALYIGGASLNAFYIDEVYLGAGEVKEDGVLYIRGDINTNNSVRLYEAFGVTYLQKRIAGTWTDLTVWGEP